MTRQDRDVRAWKSIRDQTIEAAIVGKNGKRTSRFVQDDQYSPLRNGYSGRAFLQVDPSMEWESGGDGADLLYFLKGEGDILHYARFTGHSDEQWRFTTQPRSTFDHYNERDELLALEPVSVANSDLPGGIDYHSKGGLVATQDLLNEL